ncbi:MAG: 50S ribosomal protein L6 [Acidobacteriia bacterium]|nr:50S ribosomal protein L6 [Terriglobia bacterium]MYG03610.1 50S ribosomal protein L6 [Terriglobia bacterium]MYK10190.1 50S ribosomal protein L6 [Terriglobia bacterium]
MSRIGKLPIEVPDGVKVGIEPGRLSVTGPKGELSVPVPDGVAAELEERTLRITCADASNAAMQGLTRALANNSVRGVTEGFKKRLEIVGVGYRAQKLGRVLSLQLGYSHPIEVLLPDGVEASIEGNTKIELSGIDKQVVGQVAASIRSLRKPDPYKQKGVRYEGERLRSKEGKSGAA